MLKWIVITFSVMTMSGCLSVAAAALIPIVGTMPVSVTMMLFNGSLAGVLALSARWYLDRHVKTLTGDKE